MISTAHRTVFVHVPKAAGQSVEQAFLDDLGLDWDARAPLLLRPNDDPAKGPPRLAHLTAAQYVELGHIEPQDWAAFYRFAVVRDPFSRTVSLYRHLGPDMPFGEWVSGWLRERLAAEEGAPKRWFVRPQSEYLCDPAGALLVQDVLRFEALGTDFARAAAKAGLKSATLPRRNATGHKPQPDIEGRPGPMARLSRSLSRRIGRTRFEQITDWRSAYDPAIAACVAELYAQDFERFGYSPVAPRVEG